MFQDLLEKLKEAEESHGTLQAECEQYRTVLAETVPAPNNFTRKRAKELARLLLLASSAFSGRNAETSSDKCRRGGGGVEVQDG